MSNLDFGQFGQLGRWTAWVTWTLDHLGNLDFGKFANSNFLETYVLKNLTRAFMAESISGLFYIIKPRRIEHLQKEEPDF